MIFNLTVQLGSESGRCRYKLVAHIRIRNKLAFRICNLDLLIRGSGSERNIYGSGTLPVLYTIAEQSEVISPQIENPQILDFFDP